MSDDPDAIRASKFQVGDHLVFHWTGNRTLYLTVKYIDDKFVYLCRPFVDQTNEYRVSLRTNEMRMFDKVGWTLLEGRFSQHTSVAIGIC